MEACVEAKYRLFSARGLTHAVINIDDEWGVHYAARLNGGELDLITLGCGRVARLSAHHIGLSEAGVSFRVASEWGEGEVRAPVLGAFNVSNLLAVLAALIASGIAFDEALAALEELAPAV